MAHKKIKNSTGKDIWGGIAFQINDIKDGISKLLRSRYDDPIASWFLAPIDCSKIAAQETKTRRNTR